MNPKPETKARPKRSDYPFRTADLKNGDHLPSPKLIRFVDAMRRWRDRSSQSTFLVY